MKTVIALLFSALMLVYGFNVGIGMGLDSKPVLNFDNCSTVIRYEDNTLTCTPLTHVKAPATPIVLELDGNLQPAVNEIQLTSSGEILQPAHQER